MRFSFDFGLKPRHETVVTAPAFTFNPSITGSDAVGSVLTVNFVAIGTPTPTATYQWTNAGVDIGGATSATYTSTTAGQTLRCRVTLNNGVGGPVVQTSNMITVTSADYIITTDAEWTALMALAPAVLSGKTAEIRGALGDTTITSKAFTTPFIVRGGVGGSVRRMNFNGTITNVTFRGLMHQMTGWPKTHDSTVMFNTCNLSGMRWESCTFRHGYGAGLVDLNPAADYPEYIRVNNVQTATTTSARYALTYQDAAAPSAWIEFFNRGSAPVHYRWGNSSVTAVVATVYSAATAYVTGNVVYVSGAEATYEALQASTNIPVTNSSYWVRVGCRVSTGTASARSLSFTPATTTHVAIISESGSQQVNARTEIGMSTYLADAFNSSGAAVLSDVFISDCEVRDMANGFKKISPANAGNAVLIDCRTRRVYMDQTAFVVDPGGTLYVMRNSLGLPFARSGIPEAQDGDARDPHGDNAQHFGPGTGTVGPLYYAGNRNYMEPLRTGVDSQGLFVNHNDTTPSYNRIYCVNNVFMGGAPNGITTGDVAFPAGGTLVYGSTVVDARDITTQTRLRFEDGANQQVYIGKSLAVGLVGNPLFDQSLDLTGTTNPSTVFSDLTAARTATTRATLDAALTTVGAAAGIGAAATVNSIDWTTTDPTQVIVWANIPSGAEWADLPSQAINTMITLPLRLILNRRASQTVVPGAGVEWRSVATDGTTQIQAWTTTSGSIQPDQYIQIRKMSSASGLTAVDFAVTINGFTQTCVVTTLAAAPSIFHTQSGTGPYFRDPANSTPANTTRMEFRANIYPTSLPGSAVRLFTQESNSCDLELTTTGGFRLYVRDGAATSVLAGVAATTGYSLNSWQTIVVDVNHSAGTASITNNGTLSGSWTWTPTASPTFPTIREIAFCGTTAGNNLLPSGWQIEYAECFFTTGGTRSPRKNVSGNAATVNADPWRQGVGDAT